jgi:hypothetical protein
MIELSAEEKQFYEDVLEQLKQLGVNTDREILYETDGGNSVLMRGKCAGHSVNWLVSYVAKIQGKEVEWLD